MEITTVTSVSAALAGAITGEAIRRRVLAGRYRRAADPPRGRSAGGGACFLARRAGAVSLPLVCALGSAWLVMAWSARPLFAVIYVLAWWVGCLLSAIDLDVHRLPDTIVLPAVIVVALVIGVLTGLTHWWPHSVGFPEGSGFAVDALGRSGVAGLALPLGLLALSLAAPSGAGLGLGDVKLSAALAPLLAWHGWQPLLVALWTSFVGAGLVAMVLLITRRVARNDHLPFGPALVLGTLLGLISAAG